jgi:hypothetical protein
VGLYFDNKFPNEQCPNCGARETDSHLIRCPNKDRTQLLIDTVEKLKKWMEMDEDGW